MSRLIFVDVEAVGRSPVNGAMTEFGAVDYTTRQTFHGVIFEGMPDPTHPPQVITTLKRVRPMAEVMVEFKQWLDSLGADRPIFVSDNPAYDFQWINAAFDATGMDNPFGHSARRIGDFWAGLNKNWHNTQEWKRYRVTTHDHHPVHDAMGNAEAFEHISREFGL